MTEENYGLQPPQDLDAERAALGAMLQSAKAVDAVMAVVDGRDFYRPAHAIIFDCIVHLFGGGGEADPVRVSSELAKRGKLENVGGAPYLMTLLQACPSPMNAAFYAKAILRKSRMRHIVETGIRWQQLGYSDITSDEELDLVVAQAETFLRGMTQSSDEGVMAGDLFEEWRTHQEDTSGIMPTPWVELTEYLAGGFRPGKVYVLAGRPGSGKSMGALNIALEIAESGKFVSVFSLEMGRLEVAERILASGAYASYAEIFRKRMERETATRIAEYIDSNSDLPFEVIDRAGITVEQIVAHIRSRKPAAVVIDYVQLITASSRSNDRREAIDHITRSLKVCAADTGTCIILCSQVNRNGADRMPTIADLRESGSIENDADVVLLLHREEGSGTVLLNVGKNRNGKMGTIEFMWRGELMRIG